MGLTLLSPHRDDAAFSCGILLSCCAVIELETKVINVFTISDYAPFAEASNVDHISRLRKNEDEQLKTLVGTSLQFCDLGLEDAPLRLRIRHEQTLKDSIGQSTYRREVEDLASLFLPLLEQADCVVLPMALGGHIDHRIVRDAGIKCVSREARVFYEDLPYAAHATDDERAKVIADLSRFGKLQPLTVRSFRGAAIKRIFASCYVSQIASSTVNRMAEYAEGNGGGENLYAGEDAARFLTRVVGLENERPLGR